MRQPDGAPVETVIVSDMHLCEAEPANARRPHWKTYKRAEFFVDGDFSRLLEHVDAQARAPLEVILNGDIFDFDAVTLLPPEPEHRIGWLARLRGLQSEEWMSLFKIESIIAVHPVWFKALRDFVSRGHRAIFVIGNHDLELHWPSVQDRIRKELASDDPRARVVFCNWFYISGGDTYVSHGHQYDHYCTVRDPIDPLILVHGRPRVRIPFGDLADRYMLNGMGYFNPHAVGNYIMPARQYLGFYLRYMLRTQPLLLWTWFWSAAVTLALTLWEYWRPSMRDPLLVDEKVQAIADHAQATPSMVRKLNALHVPSACTNPFKIMRELWLDRGVLFLIMVYIAFQVILAINFVWPISPWWILVPIALLFPIFLLYSFRVRPAVFVERLLTPERADLIARITGVRQAVFGHTHEPELQDVGPLRYANGGFWSPAFAKPDSTTRVGTQTFVWIKPSATGEGGQRTLALYEWPPGAKSPVPYFDTRARPHVPS
jgi:UDP-2,3-diacylglucosamine pyrophosphatase LpxH